MAEGFIDLSSFDFCVYRCDYHTLRSAITVIKTIKYEIRRSIDIGYHDIRRDFTNKIVFGLDFLVASDILRTIVATSRRYSFLGRRSAVMGYFLPKEASFDIGKKEN